MIDKCKICSSSTKTLEDPQLKVSYSICKSCGFIYKNPSFHLAADAEHKQYKRHNNSLECSGYVKIFTDLIEEYIKPLHFTGKVLEFGSGPNPVLKILLEREKYQVFDYDPFFNPNEDYKKYKYDLITTTEVAEHFNDPLKEFNHLSSLLNKGRYLIVMTKLRLMSQSEFLNWWYRRDITHISFYSLETLEYIANLYNLELFKHNNNNIIVFKKK